MNKRTFLKRLSALAFGVAIGKSLPIPDVTTTAVQTTEAANMEVIAGWLRITRKSMNNIPGFIAFLQKRLPEQLNGLENDTELV